MIIATWNLERPRPNTTKLELINRQLNITGADIWILTETNEAAYLGKDYIVRYSVPVPGLPKSGEHWLAIASSWQIVQEIETATPDISLCVEIQAPDGYPKIIIYGTVLPYMHYIGWRGSQKAWEAHYSAIELQSQDWIRLKKDYPDHLRCLAGDFNQNRDGVQRYYGTKKGRSLLSDALSDSELICRTDEDMIANHKLSNNRNIDHICLNSPWAQKASEPFVWEGTNAGGKHMSDHNGVSIHVTSA